jgi:hypothetical protein
MIVNCIPYSLLREEIIIFSFIIIIVLILFNI